MTEKEEGKTAQVRKVIADKVAAGKKHIMIHATDKDGHKYDVRVNVMPELSRGEINGTAAVIIDGNHYRDMTLLAVEPIFDHMVSVTIN
jgi:hypothetical protein